MVILAKDDAGGYIGKMREGVCYNLSFPLARSLPRHVTILNEHSEEDDDDDNNEDGRDDRSIGRLLQSAAVARGPNTLAALAGCCRATPLRRAQQPWPHRPAAAHELFLRRPQ